MSRLKRILAGAAAIVGLGVLGLSAALQQSALDEGLSTCAQWGKAIDLAESRQSVEWYALVTAGYVPPSTLGDRVLGTVDGTLRAGRIHATPAACERGLEYTYKRGATIQGAGLYQFSGDRRFARGWELLAASAPEVRYFGGWKEVVAACLAVTTGARCLNYLGGVSECWKLAGGNLCRHGLEYGPGLGGVNVDGTPATCSPGVGSVPYPCTDHGRGRDWAENIQPLDVTEE